MKKVYILFILLIVGNSISITNKIRLKVSKVINNLTFIRIKNQKLLIPQNLIPEPLETKCQA
jgi:hypothetical protein